MQRKVAYGCYFQGIRNPQIQGIHDQQVEVPEGWSDRDSWTLSRKNQLIKSVISLFEHLLVPEVNPKLMPIIRHHCKLYGDVMAGKNNLHKKPIEYTCDAMEVCNESLQLLYLPMNAAILQLLCMQNHLKKVTRAWGLHHHDVFNGAQCKTELSCIQTSGANVA